MMYSAEKEPHQKKKPCMPCWAKAILITFGSVVALVLAFFGLKALGLFGGGAPSADPMSYYATMEKSCKAFIQKAGTGWPTTANNPYASTSWTKEQKEQFAKDAINTRPLVHHKMVPLLKSWLQHKKQHGIPLEKEIYGPLDIVGLVDRLLKKRAVEFWYNGREVTRLRDGRRDEVFGTVGTTRDSTKLLKDYMSYDEMKLAALLTVSSPVQLINTGSRKNAGRAAAAGTYQPEAIYLGQVGCRFEVPYKMEHSHMHPDGLRQSDPTRHLFGTFYGVDLKPGTNTTNVLSARYKSSAMVHLAEAQYWGTQRNSNVRVNVTGLGTGVWARGISKHVSGGATKMNALIMRSYIRLLANGDFPKVTVVEFNYSDTFYGSFQKYKNKYFPNASDLTNEGNGRSSFTESGRKYVIHNGASHDGHPFVKVPELIVANYAWDSNAFPGNEYWGGDLTASGDPAAACCSTIWNHMNPECNGKFMSGDNTMVIQPNGTMTKLTSYL